MQGLFSPEYNHWMKYFSRYTESVLQSFSSAGIPVEMISLGNEINSGLLLPVGNTSSTAGYSAASEILHSAASAVRQISPSTKTMIHLADGWSSSEQEGFYSVFPCCLALNCSLWWVTIQQIFLQGKLATADVDIMGHSFCKYRPETTLNPETLNSSPRSILWNKRDSE